MDEVKKKVRVLYPILHYPPVIGGIEQWTEQIAGRQPDDVEIVIVTGRVRGTQKLETVGNVTIIRDSFVELQDLSHSSLWYLVTTFFSVCIRSFFVIRDQKIDLVHCHGFLSAVIGFALSNIVRRPFVCTEQSVGWASGFLKIVRNMVYRKAVCCIAASSVVAREYRKVGVVNIEIIPNGVDTQAFSSHHNVTLHGDTYTILSVGRLEKVKGHQYLIEAFVKKVKRDSGSGIVR